MCACVLGSHWNVLCVSGGRTQTEAHLVHAVVEEGQAGVLIADKGALLDEADEQLGLGHQGVELVMRSVTALEESLPEIV